MKSNLKTFEFEYWLKSNIINESTYTIMIYLKKYRNNIWYTVHIFMKFHDSPRSEGFEQCVTSLRLRPGPISKSGKKNLRRRPALKSGMPVPEPGSIREFRNPSLGCFCFFSFRFDSFSRRTLTASRTASIFA